MLDNTVNIKEANLKQIIDLSDGLVLINICNPESGVYIIMSPIIQRLKEAFQTDLKFYRLDSDHCTQLMNELRLSGNCHMLLYKNGTLEEIMDGLIPFKNLFETIDCYARKG